jgi:poly-beta-hydroxyalkanoate depolymerase
VAVTVVITEECIFPWLHQRSAHVKQGVDVANFPCDVPDLNLILKTTALLPHFATLLLDDIELILEHATLVVTDGTHVLHNSRPSLLQQPAHFLEGGVHLTQDRFDVVI